MSLEFIGRLQKELSFTGNAVHESVIAVAERVNRKVHILRLHAQAASLLSQIETVQGELGRQIVNAMPAKPFIDRDVVPLPGDLERSLNHSTDHIHRLKQTLVLLDGQIRELKMETIHEDLLTLQRDLSLRDAALERFIVAEGAAAVGKSSTDPSVPSSVRLVTIFRGPFLIPPSDACLFKPDDIVIAIGLRADLDRTATWFAPLRKAKTA